MRSTPQSYSFPSHRSHQQLQPPFLPQPSAQQVPVRFADTSHDQAPDMTASNSSSDFFTHLPQHSSHTLCTNNPVNFTTTAISSSSPLTTSTFDSANAHHYARSGDSYHNHLHPFSSVKYTSSDYIPNGIPASSSNLLNICHPLPQPVPLAKLDTPPVSYPYISPLPLFPNNVNTTSTASTSSSSLPNRQADRLCRLQTPGLMVLIHTDKFENDATQISSRFYTSLPKSDISYSRLLNLIATSGHTSLPRAILAAHSVTVKDSSARQPEPCLIVTTPTICSSQHRERAIDICMARLLTQEFEGVHLLGCAHHRVFCIVAVDPDFVDVVRHARFSGCDVELWFWLTSEQVPSIWTSEISLQHDNIGSLRIYSLNPYLPYLTGAEDKLIAPTDHIVTYNTYSSSLIQNPSPNNLERDIPSQVNLPTNTSSSAISSQSTPFSSQYSLYPYNSVQSKQMSSDRQLHNQTALSTSVWSGYPTFVSQSPQASASPSSRFLPTYNQFKPLVSKYSTANRSLPSGLSQYPTHPSSYDTVPNGSAAFSESLTNKAIPERALLNELFSNGSSSSRKDASSGREVNDSQNESPTDSASPKAERDMFRKLSDMTIVGNGLVSVTPSLPSNLLFAKEQPPVAGSTNPTSPTNDPADSPSPQMNTSFSNSTSDYPHVPSSGTLLTNHSSIASGCKRKYSDQHWFAQIPTESGKIECSDNFRSTGTVGGNEREEESLQKLFESGQSTSSGIPKAKPSMPTRSRCTYREFCNRRQCNGTHTKAELAYFTRFGGRAKYCLGKQKLCARGATCDGRKRRSGVCSFLHQGEVPFCAACLLSHEDGACDMERSKTVSENEAAQLVIVGCLVPVTTRQST